MTLEQENDYQVLGAFIRLNTHLTKPDFLDLIKEKGVPFYEDVFNRYIQLGYFNKQSDLSYGTTEKPYFQGLSESTDQYTLSKVGINYIEWILQQKILDDLQKQQIQSVIDTNKSVKNTNDQLVKLGKSQKVLTIVTLIIAVISVLTSVASVYVSLSVTTDKELQKINLTLQDLRRQVQNRQLIP